MRTCHYYAAVLLYLAAAFAPDAKAQGLPSEDAVKAAYLVKLRHYVEWPPRVLPPGESRTIIGLVGAEAVFDHLVQMPAVRDPGKAGLTVRRLRLGDSIAGINILFVDDSVWGRAGAMVSQAKSQSTLVVSESDAALYAGSVINFRLVDERIRFEVSLEAADKSNLKLSSQLLTLAMSVIREQRK